MDLVAENINTSAIHCPELFKECGRRYIMNSPRLRIIGTRAWGLKFSIRRNTPNSFNAVTTPVNQGLLHSYCNTELETTTACIRISMVSTYSRYKSRPCSPSRGKILTVESSY